MDIGNHRVQKFTKKGDFLSSFAQEDLLQPTSIAFDADRSFLYIADPQQKKILVFGKHGKKLKEYGGGILRDPRAVSIHKGFLFVADQELGIVFLPLTKERQIRDFLPWHKKKRWQAPQQGRETRQDWFRVLVTDAAKYRFAIGNLPVQDMAIAPNDTIFLVVIGQKHVVTLVPQETRYTNLEVRIVRLHNNAFPRVILEVTVQDSAGRFMSSLDTNDFSVQENGGSVSSVGVVNASSYRQSNQLILVREDTPFFQSQLADKFSKLLEASYLPTIQKRGC